MNKSRQPKSTKYGLASSTWTGKHTWDSEPCWLVNYRIYLMEDLRLSNYKKINSIIHGTLTGLQRVIST